MNKPWWYFVKSKEAYEVLVNSGLAWELHADLPLSWEDAKQKLKELGMEEEK